MFVSVALDLALNRLFTYEVPEALKEKLRIGQLLLVPFSGRLARGFALKILSEVPARTSPAGRPIVYKRVDQIFDEAPFFSASLLKLVKWMSVYTASPIERALKAAVPAAVLNEKAKPRQLFFVEALPHAATEHLTAHQQEVLANIARVHGGWMQQLMRELSTSSSMLRTLEKKGVVSITSRAHRRDPLAGRSFLPQNPLTLNAEQARALELILKEHRMHASAPMRPILLHGVTGSGKTEIYLQAIAQLLSEGLDAIVLVPEISLTPQTVRRFARRFGNQIAVLHSALSDGERYDEWHRIRTGEARVVVGPRSAVFAPVRHLGLIVVDEEHDPSYKQGETPRYHARDVAIMRGRFENALVVLGSATPSLESWLNVQKGKFILASISHRVSGRALPDVHLINMDQETAQTGRVPLFSNPLLEAIRLRLARGEQTILFLNRRGFARVIECPNCGWTFQCPHCSVAYTYHQADRCVRCHVCGAWDHVPQCCPTCHGTDLDYVGIGTQRVESALARCFPQARVLRMDADSTSRKNSHDDLLSAFQAGKADILLGTQMIAKGLDFPNVTLVGVLNADTSLSRPDPRACERTYQLLAQVSGRAGRAEKPGEVYLQTFSPDHPALVAAASEDGFAAFAKQELAIRRQTYFPPYCKMANLIFRSQRVELAQAWSELYEKALKSWAENFNREKGADLFRVSEACEAALARAENWFRFQVTVRAPSSAAIVQAVTWIEKERPHPKDVRIAFDVDALDMT